MTALSIVSQHRNCRRFLAATHHVAILNNYSRDLQVLHFTVESGVSFSMNNVDLAVSAQMRPDVREKHCYHLCHY